MENTSKIDQIQQAGEKAKEKITNLASNAGKGIIDMLKGNNKPTEVPKLSNIEIQKQKMESQIVFFIFLFIGILLLIGLIFVSKTFRVYTTLQD